MSPLVPNRVNHGCRQAFFLTVMSFAHTILLHNVSFYPWLLGFTNHLQGLGYLHPKFQIPNASPDDKRNPNDSRD